MGIVAFARGIARQGLDQLDLEVRPAEVFGYFGPNGAGKTISHQVPL